MPGYAFRPGIYHCFAGDYSIILDLKRDRYLALDAMLHETLKRLATGSEGEGDRPQLETLVSRAILINSDNGTRPSLTPYDVPDRDYRMSAARAARGGVVWAVGVRIRVLAALRLSSLETVLTRAVARRDRQLARLSQGSKDIALSISASFRASDLLLASQNKCLARSIAMFEILSASGVRASLVLGVSSRPFMAHCWIEQDGMILSDLSDNVRPYTPILIL